MPRNPLLGRNSTMYNKQNRSFTVQAEQTIWDIGNPVKGVEKRELIISEFRSRLEGGEFPISQDHSGSLSEPRLAWTTEVQELDFKDMFPKLIEGFLDNMSQYRKIALLTLKDSIKHGDPHAIADSIPYFITMLGKVLKYYNETAARLVLVFLKILLLHCVPAGPALAPYLGKIFMFFNVYMIDSSKNLCNMEDYIFYYQYKEPCMTEYIEEVMQLAEMKAGNDGMLAAIKLKEAIPSYQSKYLS